VIFWGRRGGEGVKGCGRRPNRMLNFADPLRWKGAGGGLGPDRTEEPGRRPGPGRVLGVALGA
jgi:hypothetical protein